MYFKFYQTFFEVSKKDGFLKIRHLQDHLGVYFCLAPVLVPGFGSKWGIFIEIKICYSSVSPIILIAPISKSPSNILAAPPCSTILLSMILSMLTPVTLILLPVGLMPIHSPLCVPLIV